MNDIAILIPLEATRWATTVFLVSWSDGSWAPVLFSGGIWDVDFWDLPYAQKSSQNNYKSLEFLELFNIYQNIEYLDMKIFSNQKIIKTVFENVYYQEIKKNVILYVQELVTLQKKYLIYLHQKMRFTPFINYYDTLGWILFVYRAK